MEPDISLSYKVNIPFLISLLATLLLIVLLHPSSTLHAETRFSLHYPDISGLVDVEIYGFSLGLTRMAGGGLGLGFGLGDKRSVDLGNWSVSPFLSGTLSPVDVELDNFAGGLGVRYFDYKIGGWALSSTSRFWLGTSGYMIGSSGSYSLGNLSLSYDLQVETEKRGKGRWYPARKGNHWTSLYRASLAGFGNTGGNYLALYGERRISLGEEDLRWSQGIMLDYRKNPGNLGLVTRFEYRGSFLLAEMDGLELDGWALQLTGGAWSIGFVESSSEEETLALSVGYRGDRNVVFEIIKDKFETGMSANLTVEW